MSDKLDELANDVDDALVTADELKDDPGTVSSKKLEHTKEVLETAQDAVDEMENAEGD